jgi:hypothetical protein
LFAACLWLALFRELLLVGAGGQQEPLLQLYVEGRMNFYTTSDLLVVDVY